MSKKRDLIKQWRNRAEERKAMADALESKSRMPEDYLNETIYQIHLQHIECLKVMADTFNLCADELDKA